MMVSSYDDSRLLLVLQIDHSRVAGHLAAHWGNAGFAVPSPYASMVLAAQEHDNGWWDWEIKPTLSTDGYPLDYVGSAKVLGRVWLDQHHNGIDRVARQDPYAGFIVSMHAEGLLTQGMGLLPYMHDYSEDAEVREFIVGQKADRASLLEEVRKGGEYGELASEEHLWTNFKLMEVFDQFAQFLCNRYPLNSTDRKNGPTNKLSSTPVPVAPGREDVTLSVDAQDETRAIVTPYPFDGDPLVVSFPGRVVPNRAYAGHDDFLEHFYKAERITISYTLSAE